MTSYDPSQCTHLTLPAVLSGHGIDMEFGRELDIHALEAAGVPPTVADLSLRELHQ